MWLNLLFFVAIIITILLMRHEVRRYSDARLAGKVPEHERQRFTRRILGGVILSIVLAMTYFASTNMQAFEGHPWIASTYILLILLMTLIFFIIALLDIRAVFRHSMRTYMSEENESERLERYLKEERSKLEQKILTQEQEK